MNQRPLVIKFGGTSVGEGAAFLRAARIAADAARSGPVATVVSAMAGMTDVLLGFARATAGSTERTISTGATREGSLVELHRSLAERHLRAAREAVSPEYLPEVEERLLALLKELAETTAAPVEDPDARRAAIAVYGERLSAEILAGVVRSIGMPTAVVERDPIVTDSNFSEAEVDVAETHARCSRYVAPLLDRGVVAVVPGYVGRSPKGLPTTLGRGGSDLSATVLGRALGSGEVWIMSDVDGVLDADPRLVSDAALMPRLSYREASLFASLGAKILHHRTMEPAQAVGMEVRVRNTFEPGSPGTHVSGIEDGSGVRCVALRRNLAIELPCAHGHENAAAMVVCIGSPDERDLTRGRRRLREAGIPLLYAGTAAAGLVFVVKAPAGEEALRILHGALVGGTTLEKEVVA